MPVQILINFVGSRTKMSAAAIDVVCFCAVSIYFVATLLALAVVVAIAVAAVLVSVAIFIAVVILIAVAVQVAAMRDCLRRFAFVRRFKSFIFVSY